MSAGDIKNSVLQVHETTLPHLDIIEKIILDELVRQGRAIVITAGESA